MMARRALSPQQALTRRKNKFFTRLTRDRRLRGLDVPVAWAILDRIGVNSPTAWPSEETIAEELNCHRVTVAKSVEALLRNGWFERERRGRGDGVSNRYRPAWDNVANRLHSPGENIANRFRERSQSATYNVANRLQESSQEPTHNLEGEKNRSRKAETGNKVAALLGDTLPSPKADCLQGQTGNNGWRLVGNLSPSQIAIRKEIQAKERARLQREAHDSLKLKGAQDRPR